MGGTTAGPIVIESTPVINYGNSTLQRQNSCQFSAAAVNKSGLNERPSDDGVTVAWDFQFSLSGNVEAMKSHRKLYSLNWRMRYSEGSDFPFVLFLSIYFPSCTLLLSFPDADCTWLHGLLYMRSYSTILDHLCMTIDMVRIAFRLYFSSFYEVQISHQYSFWRSAVITLQSVQLDCFFALDKCG